MDLKDCKVYSKNIQNRSMRVISHSEEETIRLGREIGKRFKKGDIVALFGELGAGKTVLVKGICKAFGIKRRVKSPSFILIREYKPKPRRTLENSPSKIFHIDLYRVKDRSSMLIQSIYECLSDRDGLYLIEWADRIEEFLPDDAVRIYMKIVGDKVREIAIPTSVSSPASV